VLPQPERGRALLRVVLGPQDDHFEPDSLRAFSTSDWAISNRMDRMGYHLNGPILRHSAKGANIVSDGIVAGSLQVPASGQPIALMMDRQPTGGYPKIATVLTADLGRLAQCRPGEIVRFLPVTVGEAVAARRLFAAHLGGLREIAEAPPPVFVRNRRDLSQFIASSDIGRRWG
jgi:allophanate hydrolase subunit 2